LKASISGSSSFRIASRIFGAAAASASTTQSPNSTSDPPLAKLAQQFRAKLAARARAFLPFGKAITGSVFYHDCIEQILLGQHTAQIRQNASRHEHYCDSPCPGIPDGGDHLGMRVAMARNRAVVIESEDAEFHASSDYPVIVLMGVPATKARMFSMVT
jgi:hypothetical protein